MTLKALMVDVDGVVVAHPDGRRWDHAMEADLGLPSAEFQAAFFKPHFNDIVLGKADLHDRLAPVLATIAPHLTCQQVTDYWFEKDSKLPADVISVEHALLTRLQLGIPEGGIDATEQATVTLAQGTSPAALIAAAQAAAESAGASAT